MGRKLKRLVQVIKDEFPDLDVAHVCSEGAQWRNQIIIRNAASEILFEFVKSSKNKTTDPVETWLREYRRELNDVDYNLDFDPKKVDQTPAIKAAVDQAAREAGNANGEMFPKQPDEPNSVDGLGENEHRMVRIRAIERLILNGHSGKGLVVALSEDLGRVYRWAEIKNDVKSVCVALSEADDIEAPAFRARQRLQLHAAARLMWVKGHIGKWTKIQRLIANLEGNDAPKKIDIRKANEFEGWTIQDLDMFAETGKVPKRIRDLLRSGAKIELPNDRRNDDRSLH